MKPIAIIGMSYRLPGDVKTDEDFWKFCCRAQSAWSEIPPARFTQGGYYHPNSDRVGSFIAKGGYFLQEDVGLFDAPFFGITAEEATSMDPQQRLLLECAYEALEQAGVSKTSLANENVGVFAGGTNSDYEMNLQRDPEYVPRSTVGGTAPSFLANRLSHFFDFKGPSYTADTACSSSLTALHAACQSLKAGESSSALVGGVHLNLVPGSFISFSSSSLLGPSGKCHSFDHRATSGYGRGEGAGCVLLRPLDAAVAAGDNIRAVIVNTGINQDGHTSIIEMPNSTAQERLMRSVYEAADINPLRTAYVEAHGTGTKAGDPVEAKALYNVFGRDQNPKSPLVIGSAKSNFGHAEGASGMVSLVKTVLMLERGFILPTAGVAKPREDIPWAEWNLEVATKLKPWPKDKPYASINNFGLGGANAHVILQKAPHLPPSQDVQKLAPRASTNEKVVPRRIYVLSASTEQAVLDQSRQLEVYLERRPELYDTRLMYNLAYTLGQRRTVLPWKIVASARSAKELISAMSAKETRPRRAVAAPRIAFVFPGQGAQWHAMGRELLEDYPIFTRAIQRVDEHLVTLGASFSVAHELTKNEEDSQISLPHISQTATTAVQIGLTDLLRSWGILPQAVIGHSSGEVPAAYAAGVLSLEDAIQAAYGRGITAMALPEDFPGIKGTMIAIGAPVEQVEPMLPHLKRGKAVVACINSGQNVTVSGDVDAIDELEEIVRVKGIFNRKLKVQVAYHSHHIRLMADKYRAYVQQIKPSDSTAVFYSSARAQRVDARELGPAYWVENGVSCVQFAPGLKQLLDGEASTGGKIDILIEVGPHPALASAISEILQASGHSAATECLPSLKRKMNATEAMHNLATELILRGQTVKFDAINLTRADGSRPSLLKDLPSYPWNHSTRYWHTSRLTDSFMFKPFPRHDLLGLLSNESGEFEPQWRSIIRPEDHPWIRDHQVQGKSAFPMAGFISMTVEAARQHAVTRKIEFNTYKLRELTVPKMLIMPDSAPVEITLSLRPYAEGTRASSTTWHEVRIFSWIDQRGWEENFRGLISTQNGQGTNPVHSASRNAGAKLLHNLARMDSLCTDPFPTDQLYDILDGGGIQYEGSFRGLKSCFQKDNETVSTLVAPGPEESASDIREAQMHLHPALIDLCVQSMWPTLISPNGMKKLLLPSYVKEIVISHGLDIAPYERFRAYCRRVTPLAYDRPMVEDIWTVPESAPNNVVLQFTGIHMTPVHDDASLSEIGNGKELCYRSQIEKCFDFMTSASLDTLLPSKADDQTQTMELLERAAAFYVRNAIRSLRTDDQFPSLPLHLRRFYEQVSRMVAEAVPVDANPSDNDLIAARNLGPPGQVISDLGSSLPAILHGEMDVASAIQQHGGLDKYFQDGTLCQRGTTYQQAATCIESMAGQKPNLRVLDLGSSMAATLQILENLTNGSRFAKYVRIDLANGSSPARPHSEVFLGKWKKQVQVQSLDLFTDPTHQGFHKHSFDLVIACQPPSNNLVLMQKILFCAHELLEHGGKLLLVEESNRFALRHFPMALLPSGWPENHGEKVNGHLSSLTPEQWDCELRQSGFSGVDLSLGDQPQGHVLVSSAWSKDPLQDRKVVIVHNGDQAESWLSSLIAGVEGITGTSPTVQRLMEASLDDGELCIFLGELTKPLLATLTPSLYQTIQQLILRASGILWVTNHATIDCKDPAANLVTGLARTVRSELGLPFVTLDLDSDTVGSSKPQAAVQTILSIFQTVFGENSVLCSGDFEFILRDGQICVPRVRHDPDADKAVLENTGSFTSDVQPVRQADRPLRLEIQDYGMLESLHFTDGPEWSSPLPEGWIEIEVQCVGLNFKDIMHANNQFPIDGFGVECSGFVTAVGGAVQEFAVGDRVCAMAEGCFSTKTRCPAASTWKIKPEMSLEVAASIPVVFTTALYSLSHVGRLQAGEKVLIHAAAGGVGQAAIMVAQAVGAEIFATVGSVTKKTFLMETYFIPEDHIFYSRDLSFVEGIAIATDGAGVDVVLNSLAGEYLQSSLDCVAPFGRFVEIGKKDITMNSRLELSHFASNISFTAVDLSVFGRDRPAVMKRLLQEVFQMFEQGHAHPIAPLNLFNASKVHSAFQLLQSGQSLGKVVVQLQDDSKVQVIPATKDTNFLDANATYMIIGGTGGLGRSISEWLATHGARRILLVSRSGSASSGVQELVDSLASRDVTVRTLACDVSEESQVRSILRQELDHGPPVRGVIHSAMVLRDAAFQNMTFDDYTTVLKPKVDGVYHLDELLGQMNSQLDFFVALSSVSGIVGNRGQSAYAAASTFLDAFTQYNQQRGRPFTAIDLAPLWEIGYLANDTQKRDRVVEVLGNEGIGEVEFHNLLTAAVRPKGNNPPNAQILTGLQIKGDSSPFWASDSRFANLVDVPSTDDTNDLATQSPGDVVKKIQHLDDAIKFVTMAISHKIAAMLICPVSEIDPALSLSKYGLDSLSSIEARKWISRELQAPLQLLEVLTSPSLTALAELVLTKSRLVSEKTKQAWKVF